MSATERRRFRPYIISNRLILHKNLSIEVDRRSSKQRVVAEYHGYRSEPRDEWLSIAKLQEKHGTRPKWEEIAIQHGILEYVLGQNGKVDKGSYEVGIGSILLQRDDIAYDEPRLGQTQALGLQPKLLASLPQLYLLPAITDYSDEIDRRSSSTVFRLADLSDRIMRSDPRYAEIERARVQLRKLLNRPSGDEASERLAALEDMESALRDTIKRLMPSIEGVHLSVEVEETKDIFAKGVDINGRRRRAPIRPGCRRERDGMTP